MKILVTGGAGYIGSVLVNKLITSGHQVKVIDDLSNGFKENIDEKADFIQGSILDNDKLNQALDGVEVVFHLAAKIRVEEGEREPELYKKVNIEGTLNQYLEKNAKSLGISSICFRFFNIGGALQTTKGNWLKIKHEGATHLIPSILHSSNEKPLLIFGNDWATKDGTPTRDFVHVVDLADALIKSLAKLEVPGNQVINLGTSTGSTVLEVVKTAEDSLKKNISYRFADRRAGDSFALVTSNEKAKQVLGWVPNKSLSEILQDAQAELLANH